MDLQTRIRDLIEDRDTTQKKVAKAVGITESTMSGYMTGKVRLPAWLVQMCAEYFQVSTDYLYGLTDDPQRPLDLSPAERDLVLNFRTNKTRAVRRDRPCFCALGSVYFHPFQCVHNKIAGG